jgi:2-amino-4-hydroxy-6-hydroxymethyldihydropteridine diphosphokinase
MAICLIGLGANLGQRGDTLQRAVGRIESLPETRRLAVSSWLETEPVGGPTGQGAFLNGAATFETALEPEALHQGMLDIEQSLGRRRETHWGPRTIDLDLLLYDRLVLKTPQLEIPHPRMAWRRFVLEPASQIAAEMIHPTIGWSIGRLLQHLNASPRYVALAGPIGAGKTHLAQRLGEDSDVRWIAETVDSSRLEAFYRDPAGTAWETEIELLMQRAALLSSVPSSRQAATGRGIEPDAATWAVSDFWFDHSMAFARVWLPQDKQAAFRQRWLETRGHVPPPRLLVVLEAPVDVLRRRIAARGRPYEQGLDRGVLERIRDAIEEQVQSADTGPVLRIEDRRLSHSYDEVRAALDAMT